MMVRVMMIMMMVMRAWESHNWLWQSRVQLKFVLISFDCCTVLKIPYLHSGNMSSVILKASPAATSVSACGGAAPAIILTTPDSECLVEIQICQQHFYFSILY